MRVLLLVVGLSLAACNIPTVPKSLPAPLAQTVVDDRGMKAAWQTFGVAVDAITLLRQTGVIKAGSEKAIRLADGIDRVTSALEAAEHAVIVGSTKSFLEALQSAQSGLNELRVALRSN